MIRTCDLCLRRAALYPLSYGRAAPQCSAALPDRSDPSGGDFIDLVSGRLPALWSGEPGGGPLL